MIGFIRGELAEKGDGYIIVDVNGVGYEIFVPANSRAYLSEEGREVMVYTAMMVKEDDVSLYGFMRKGELDAVNGVGAKAAISILSSFTLEQIQQAIAFEDVKTITKANGIGKKTAERIVLELKDKFGAAAAQEAFQEAAGSDVGADVVSDGRSEAVSALMALGYTRGEAMSALSSVEDSDLTAEEYIKRALRNLF